MSPQKRSERRNKVRALTRSFCHQWFDSQGRWQASAQPPDTRSLIRLCFGLFPGCAEDIQLANAILNAALFPSPPTEQEKTKDSGFDIFVSNHAAQLLSRHRQHMTDDVRLKMESWAQTCLRDYLGDRQADYQFHGFNDNFPAKACVGLILGGEYFGDREAVAHGLWNLRQLCNLLSRRGLISEYTSPTYTPLSVVNLSEIAAEARSDEARELASLCVERIWADFFAHYHKPSGMMGGPFSRSYAQDSVGHLSSANAVLWFVMEGVIPDPLSELTDDPARLFHRKGHHPTSISVMAWIAAAELNPPGYLVEWLKRRTYPFHCVATAERGGSDGGGEILSTHYQEEVFALGTSEGDTWTQRTPSDPFFLQYLRKPTAANVEHVRTLFTRYLTDEQTPHAKFHRLESCGMLHTVQHERTALVLARPAFRLVGQEVTALRYGIFLPVFFGSLEKIVTDGEHIFVKDGAVYFAIRSLNATDWGGTREIETEVNDGFQIFWLANYRGSRRKFSHEEITRTLNGFAFVISPQSEESFDSFCTRVKAAELIDYYQTGMRTVQYRIGDTALAMNYGLESDRVRFATINNRLVSRPAWEADGLPATSLPLLERSPSSEILPIPYRHLRVSWAPDAPWTINENAGHSKSDSYGPGWRRRQGGER